jgi:hypothetical protein
MDHLEQQTNIKFGAVLIKLVMKMLQMFLMVYGEQMVTWSKLFE